MIPYHLMRRCAGLSLSATSRLSSSLLPSPIITRTITTTIPISSPSTTIGKTILVRNFSVADKNSFEQELMKGAEHLKARQYDEAHALFSSALQKAQSDADKSREIASLQGIAAATMGQGEFEQAIKHYEQLLEMTQDDVLKNAGTHLSLGSMYKQVGNVDKALVLLVKGLEKTKDAKRDQHIKRVQRDLAWTFIDTAGQNHKYKDLKNFVKNIKYITRRDKDFSFEVDAYTRCANAVGHNSTATAKEFIDDVLQLVQTNPFAGLQRENWQALMTLATIYKSANELTNAEKYFNQALDYAKSINDSERVLNSMQGLGTVFQNRPAEAIPLYQNIIKYCKESQNIQGEIEAMLNMAIYYTKTNDTPNAESYFQQARALAKQHDKIDQDVLAQAYLAVYHHKLNQPTGRSEMQQAIVRARGEDHKKALRMCLEDLSVALLRESNWKEAIEAIKELLPLQTGDLKAQVKYIGLIQRAFKEIGDQEGEEAVISDTLFSEAGLPWLTRGLSQLPKVKK